MDCDGYMNETSARMATDGYALTQANFALGAALIGYQHKFRLRWVATKLHLFTIVIPVPVVTLDVVGQATEQSLEYAKRTKGKLRGLQTGVAVIPVLVAREIPPDVVANVRVRPKKRFAAITLPVVVDLQANTLHHYDGRLVWGAVYASWLNQRVQVINPATYNAPDSSTTT
jgi:hypothetical protein